MKKRIIGVLITFIYLVSFIPNVYAGNVSVSASSTTITVGNSVNITVKADGIAGKFSVFSSNGDVLSGGGSDWLENSSKTYNFTSKNTGTATITVRPDNAADFNGNKYTASKTITINVVKPREKSTNNNLKSLSVEGQSISPEFNKNTLEYTVNLESSIEKITINATKEDGYARLEGTGEKEVIEGDNKFEIKVTSETGNTKIYTINAVVKDSNPITKKVDNNEYTVVKRASLLIKPEGFEEKTVNINDVEIPAFYNEITDITLVGLRDNYGEIELYCYDEKKDSYQKFYSLTSLTKTIVFIDTEEEIEGFEKKKITIVNSDYTVYQRKNNNEYSLIYGIDLETGKKDWYLFHNKEQTIQTYMSDIINDMQNDFDSKLNENKTGLLILAGISGLLLIVIIIEILSKNKIKKKYQKKIDLLKRELAVKKEDEKEEAKSKKNKSDKK